MSVRILPHRRSLSIILQLDEVQVRMPLQSAVADEDYLAHQDIENSISFLVDINCEFSDSESASSDTGTLPIEHDGVVVKKKQKPIFTALYVTTVLLLFLYGIYFITGEKNVTYSSLSPISPPIERLYFETASPWPHCQDSRSQWWRLFSHQVVHAGYMHVISNQCLLLIFGIFYEANQGFMRTLVIFELSILGGCMGHAAVWPLRPLIGNSHGVYGLFGASTAEVILNADMMKKKNAIVILTMCFVQLSIDIVGFIWWFNPHVGYSAHAAGFLSGLLMSFVLSSRGKTRIWKSLVGFLSVIAFSGGQFYVLAHYERTWPPEALITPSWSDIPSQTCCAASLRYQERLDVNQDYIVEHYSCKGWDLEEKT